MDEESVGLRELKARLSAYIRQVKEGQAVLITEHGRPVGRIVPVGQSVEERLQNMARAGLVAWTGRRLGPSVPVARVRGEGTVADLLVAGRE